MSTNDLPAVLLSLLHSGAKERKRRLDNYGTRAREGGVRCRGEQPQDRCVDEAVASFYRQQAVDVPIPHAGGTGPRRGPDVNAHANCVRIHAWARGSRRRRRTSRQTTDRLLTARCMRSPTHHVPAPPCPASLARSHIEASIQLQDGVLNSRASWPLTASRRC